MDGAQNSSAREEKAQSETILRIAQVAIDEPDPVGAIADELGPGPFDLICLFVSPDADFPDLTKTAARRFAGQTVLACTTAGEIGQRGYEERQIIALAFPSALFSVATHTIRALDEIDEHALIDDLIQKRMDLTYEAPEKTYEFAFLMVDGLSQREENLTTLLASGLGPMPLFGGSSGDGVHFRATYLSHNGETFRNAALLAMVRSRCPVRVFSLDNFVPTETRMVVTSADPDGRVVYEINAEPAALEYARLLGKDPNQLDPFTFASHPVVVRLGDSHHVRAIQRVGDKGELIFFSAINEGMVLTLARHENMVTHLDRALDGLARDDAPSLILGCDCMLRRVEAEQTQQTRAISDILRRFNVVGFSTYGEQIGALHVNQTLTGVAIYPPAPPGRD